MADWLKRNINSTSKKIAYCIVGLVGLGVVTATAQPIGPGTNVRTEYKRLSPKYYVEAPPLSPWAEGQNMLMICDKSFPLDCDVVFLALHDTSLVGVYIPADTMFLFDNEGNGTLGLRTEPFLLPMWAIKRHSVVNPKDTGALAVLNHMYDNVLQSNEAHVDKELSEIYDLNKSDVTIPNRHIILLFDNYQALGRHHELKHETPDPRIGIFIMKKLADECTALYGKIPAIVYVYQCEALIRAHMMDEARMHLEKGLELFPDSVPLQLYEYRLEQDTKKQKKLLRRLREDHPNHWAVKELKDEP